MTNLDSRPVRRETRAIDPVMRRKNLIVLLELGGRVLRIRCKGDRRWYTVPYEEIYRIGCRLRAQELKAEKAERRRARLS
jgi:hypothetical protein